MFDRRLSEKNRMSAAEEFEFRQGTTRELVETNDRGETLPEFKFLAARKGPIYSPTVKPLTIYEL
jgi:hypothetical protein